MVGDWERPGKRGGLGGCEKGEPVVVGGWWWVLLATSKVKQQTAAVGRVSSKHFSKLAPSPSIARNS